MSKIFDAIIVGGGIIGSSCAMHLAESDLSVLLIEAKEIGSGTSAAGMGHIVVLDDSEEQFVLSSYSRKLWKELSCKLPEDVQWKQFGTIWVAADDEEMQIVKEKHAFYTERGIKTEVLDKKALAEAEPNLREDLVGGLLVCDDAVIYPQCASLYFANRAKENNGSVLINSKVKEINTDGTVLLGDGRKFSGGIIVNAAGCDSVDLSKNCGVFKRKGHLVVTDSYPGLIRHQVIELGYLKSAHVITSDSVAFNIQPRISGKMLIGSSRQSNADDSRIDHVVLAKMLDRAFDYIPRLRHIWAVRTWCGFRPATPDKLPLIGPSPDSEKIWFATGHEGLGITTSTGTGRLLADMVLGKQPEIPCEPYLPNRCAVGDSSDAQ